MDPEKKNSFELQVNMKDEAECYYELYVDKKNLDTKNNIYEWQIIFTSLSSVIPSMSQGKNLQNIEDDEIINLSNG